MRKQIAYTLLAAVAAAGIYIGIRSQRIVRNEAYFNTLSQYIYAYTDGVIGRNDAIRVRFAQPVAGAQAGQPVETGVLKIEPVVAGAAVWEDNQTLKFQPEQALPYGQHYTAALALRKLFSDVPYDVRRFDFEFSVRALAYEVETDGVSVDLLNPGRQRITGRVRVNEPCEAANVEKILNAEQGGRALPVRWTHKEDKLTHEWVVEGVERGKIRSKVALKWSGKAIGVDKKGEAEQVVAAADEFGVLGARVIQVEEQYILLNFSDPLAASQNLDGLIRIEGYNGKLRFLTDLNNVRVYPATRLTGEHNLRIEAGIRSSAGQAMKERAWWVAGPSSRRRPTAASFSRSRPWAFPPSMSKYLKYSTTTSCNFCR
jgi:alpha-2-macroglobulin